MGKRDKSTKSGAKRNGDADAVAKKSIVVDEQAVDPALAALFASSAGPIKAPPKSRYEEAPPVSKKKAPIEESDEGEDDDEDEAEEEGDQDDLSSVDEDLEDADLADLMDEDSAEEEPKLDKIIDSFSEKPQKKRKRKNQEEDLEGQYMDKLAREEAKEEVERQIERKLKRQRIEAEENNNEAGEAEDSDAEEEAKDSDANSEEGSESDGDIPDITEVDHPIHESLLPIKDREAVELEKAARTVFLANVSTDAISSKTSKKALLAHLGSFLSSLPAPKEGNPVHKVESIRFRSTAFSSAGLPKKASFVKKDLMAGTTKSTNAYVVYSSAFAAREAIKRLNGTMILERHLRVDGVAHPAKTDHRRCVFVGNLGFVDDETIMDKDGETERKRRKTPSDIEEGLWRQMGKAGKVESVRVIRDEKTRVGKGFAYVQFEDANSVEAALLFNEKKYPPMLPRILRVVRAKAMGKTALASGNSRPDFKSPKQQIYNPKDSSEFSSLKGRASKLLGKAGAAQIKKKEGSGANDTMMGTPRFVPKEIAGIAKTPEAIVFEGYRASSNGQKPGRILGTMKGKGKGKPKSRSSKRGTEWKKTGGRKEKAKD